MRLKCLELFGCQGGATAGYITTGFDVYVVDMERKHEKYNPSPTYLVADAMKVCERLIAGELIRFYNKRTGRAEFLGLSDFAFVHGSPPCQGYTRGNAGKVTAWPKLIDSLRELFIAMGIPYVIENVKDAGYTMIHPVELCGCMFDMNVIDTDGIPIHMERLRLFETSWDMKSPSPHNHDYPNVMTVHEGKMVFSSWVAGAYGGARRDKFEAKYVRKGGYVPPEKSVVAVLLGVEHDMTWAGLFECLPPAYTQYVGDSVMAHILSEGMK